MVPGGGGGIGQKLKGFAVTVILVCLALHFAKDTLLLVIAPIVPWIVLTALAILGLRWIYLNTKQ